MEKPQFMQLDTQEKIEYLFDTLAKLKPTQVVKQSVVTPQAISNPTIATPLPEKKD